MHKCMSCGTEFEGKFCPECGAKWGEVKTCPNCGKPAGGTKFCVECGYSFVAAKQPSGFKKKLSAILAWCKSHLKIVVPSAIALVVLITLLSLIPTFKLASVNGTYYYSSNGDLSEDNYVKLTTGKWTSGKSSGKYTVKGKQVTLTYVDKDAAAIFGEDSELAISKMVGTVKNKVLVIQRGENSVASYCRKDHKHKYSSWETKIEPTCTQEGIEVKACMCGLKETRMIEATGHNYGDRRVPLEEESCTATWQYNYSCSVCGFEYKETFYAKGHNIENGYCTRCRKPQLNYELTANGKGYTVMLTGGFGESESITIPNKFNNLPVTSIGDRAFYGCSKLTSVTIPDSVTNIGDYAFYKCSSLASITIPDSVTSIGGSAFQSCSKLESITLPFVGARKDGTENIHFGYIFGASKDGDNSQYVPSSLKTVIIKSGSRIGRRAFFGCSSLTSIVIPDSLTNIGSSAFRNCSSLTSIVIPDSVIEIEYEAFSGCFSLTIYCEAEEQPNGWNYGWNYSNRPVVWGYKGD